MELTYAIQQIHVNRWFVDEGDGDLDASFVQRREKLIMDTIL